MAPNPFSFSFSKTGNSQAPAQRQDPIPNGPPTFSGSFQASSPNGSSQPSTNHLFPVHSRSNSSSKSGALAQNVPSFSLSAPTQNVPSLSLGASKQHNGLGLSNPTAHHKDVAELTKRCESRFTEVQEGSEAQAQTLLHCIHHDLVEIAGALQVQHRELAHRRSSLDAWIEKTAQNTHELDALRSEVPRVESQNGNSGTRNKEEIMKALKEVSDALAANNAQKMAREENVRLMQADLRAHEAELKALKTELELETLKRNQHEVRTSQSASSSTTAITQSQPAAPSTSKATSMPRKYAPGQLAPSNTPCNEKTLDNLARASITEQGGIMMQFVEYAAGQVIDEAISIIASEREAEKRKRLQEEAQPYREEFLKRKYGKRWRQLRYLSRLRKHTLKRLQSQDLMSAFHKSREAKKRRIRSSQELEAIRAATKESEEMKRQIEGKNAQEARAKAFAQFQEDLKKQEKANRAREIANARKRTSVNSLSPGTKRAMPGTFDEDDFGFTTEKLPPKPVSKRQRASTTNGVHASSNDHRSDAPSAHQLYPNSPEAIQAANIRRLAQTSKTPFRDSMRRENRVKILQPVSDYWLLKARGIDPETPVVSHTKTSLEAKKSAEKNQRQEDLRQSQSFASSVFNRRSITATRAPPRNRASLPVPRNTSASTPTSNSTITSSPSENKSNLSTNVAHMAADIRQMSKDFKEMRDWYRDARLQIEQEHSRPQTDQSQKHLPPHQARSISSSSRPSSSHSSPYSTALTDDYGRDFVPGKLTYKNGYPFYPSEQLSRAEMRYRRTGGFGLCAVDPVMMRREGVEMLNERVRRKRFGKGKGGVEYAAEDSGGTSSEQATEELSQDVFGEVDREGEQEEGFFDQDGEDEAEGEEEYDEEEGEGEYYEDGEEDDDDGYGGEASTPSSALQAVGATQDEPIELD